MSPEVEELLRTDPRVHLTGMNWDTPPLYTAMDVVVLPTYREGFPVVPMEAAAMELPVVATEVPGCVDAVQDSVTGTLVPPRDASALTEAIRHYLLDPELRRRTAGPGGNGCCGSFGRRTSGGSYTRSTRASYKCASARFDSSKCPRNAPKARPCCLGLFHGDGLGHVGACRMS